MTYGNGDSVSYTYDAFDRQRTAAYNDGTTYHYDYSSDNALTRQYATDGSGITEQYSYQYDSLGRLIHSRQSTADGSLIQLTQHMYDNANRLTSQSWQFGGDTFRQSYTYTGQNSDGKQVDGTISAITTTIPDQLAITSKYEYNDLRQLEKKTVTVPDQNGRRPRSMTAPIPMRSSRRMTAATGWVRVWRARATRSARAAAASRIPMTMLATSSRSWRPTARACCMTTTDLVSSSRKRP